ncbi:hypothetical protein [Modestobacter sp. SYSU DS0875]
MSQGLPFTVEDLARWPAGAERVEIVAGALCFVGLFGDQDLAVAQRVYPAHRVRLEDGDLWVLPEGCESVTEVLGRVTGPLPPAEPRALDAEIGPFYDTAGVAALLGGVSEQAVHARRMAHTILAERTADGRWVYPTFQFTGSEVDPALAPAIQAFTDVVGWTAALWFITPNPDLDDATAPCTCRSRTVHRPRWHPDRPYRPDLSVLKCRWPT